MKVAEYLKGRPVRLVSPLDPATVQAAINAHTRSGFQPFGKGVVGWVRMGRVRLRYRAGFFDYNAKPVLVGRAENDMGRTRLELSYRAPLKVYGFIFLWFLILTIFWGIVSQALAQASSLESIALKLVLFLVYLLMPLWVHWIGTLDAEEELDLLLQFLRQHAKAEIAPD